MTRQREGLAAHDHSGYPRHGGYVGAFVLDIGNVSLLHPARYRCNKGGIAAYASELRTKQTAASQSIRG